MKITSGRVVHELTLTDSIRYANGDPVERWLYDLLCLDVTDLPPLIGGTPDPGLCDLYYVNRDTLFSYDRSAEKFLKHLVNLYVSSHYKVCSLSDDTQYSGDRLGARLGMVAVAIDQVLTLLLAFDRMLKLY